MDVVSQGLISVAWCEGVRLLMWRYVRRLGFLFGLLIFVES